MTDESTMSRGANPLDVLPQERYGITVDLPQPLLQKHLENFHRGLFDRSQGEDQPMSVIRGNAVRVAVELGWIKGIDVIDISGMHAGKVAWAYSVIAYHLEKAVEIPPN